MDGTLLKRQGGTIHARHRRTALLSVIGGLFLLGCACGQLLTGDPLFYARGFSDDAEALLEVHCPDAALAAQLRVLCDQVWVATAEGLLTQDDIFVLEALFEERLTDGCQDEDVVQILTRYPMLSP